MFSQGGASGTTGDNKRMLTERHGSLSVARERIVGSSGLLNPSPRPTENRQLKSVSISSSVRNLSHEQGDAVPQMGHQQHFSRVWRPGSVDSQER